MAKKQTVKPRLRGGLSKEAREEVKERKKNVVYVGRTPHKLKPGWTLAHNHVRHTIDMGHGRNGFRGWWFTQYVPKDFKACGCGWSGLPHVSANPKYKSEPEEVIAAFG
jgi:hypothetical protein